MSCHSSTYSAFLNHLGLFSDFIMSDEKKFLRFKPAYDILLLREVVARQPDGKQTWEEVVASLNSAISGHLPGMSVTLRACRCRLRTLVESHKKEEMASLRA